MLEELRRSFEAACAHRDALAADPTVWAGSHRYRAAVARVAAIYSVLRLCEGDAQ